MHRWLPLLLLVGACNGNGEAKVVPPPPAAAPAAREKAVIVELGKDGTATVDGAPVAAAALRGVMATKDGDDPTVVRADASVAWSRPATASRSPKHSFVICVTKQPMAARSS